MPNLREGEDVTLSDSPGFWPAPSASHKRGGAGNGARQVALAI